MRSVIIAGVSRGLSAALFAQLYASGARILFPMRDVFVGLHETGQLAAPAAVASRILGEYLQAR